MRVLCITHHSDRPEAETFIGLKKRGVDIEVMCQSSAPYFERLVNAGIPVIDMALKSRIDISGILKIRKHIKKKNVDILHLFNNRAVSNGILSAIGCPVKIIAYRGIVANVSFFDPASWMTYLNPKVDCIVCVAEAVRRYFLNMRLLWYRVPQHKVITIYKGHSLEWYREKPAGLGEFGIPDDAFVVGCVANMRPRKGIHVLVDAARFLSEQLPVHFLLVGHMNSPELKRQIETSPCKERIHQAGFRENAPAIMAACDMIVLPALKREGLPKVVIEAMAYGVAPVVTDSGGSPELIEQNKSGLIIPPGDAQAIAGAIMQLYKNTDFCKEMGKNARVRIGSSFRIEDTIAKTHALYQRLMAS